MDGDRMADCDECKHNKKIIVLKNVTVWCSEHGEQEGNTCKECLKKVK